jgi:hypothetical protein
MVGNFFALSLGNSTAMSDRISAEISLGLEIASEIKNPGVMSN